MKGEQSAHVNRAHDSYAAPHLFSYLLALLLPKLLSLDSRIPLFNLRASYRVLDSLDNVPSHRHSISNLCCQAQTPKRLTQAHDTHSGHGLYPILLPDNFRRHCGSVPSGLLKPLESNIHRHRYFTCPQGSGSAMDLCAPSSRGGRILYSSNHASPSPLLEHSQKTPRLPNPDRIRIPLLQPN